MVGGMLGLDKFVVLDVSGQKRLGLSRVGILRDTSKGVSKLILTIFPRDVTTVAWHLSSRVDLTHQYIYNFLISRILQLNHMRILSEQYSPPSKDEDEIKSREHSLIDSTLSASKGEDRLSTVWQRT